MLILENSKLKSFEEIITIRASYKSLIFAYSPNDKLMLSDEKNLNLLGSASVRGLNEN